VWLGEGVDVVQIYTGDTLPDVSSRRRSIAIEPMSCPPNAFRDGVGVNALEPGEAHVFQWGARPWLESAS
jgi:aldose 1-epimerase